MPGWYGKPVSFAELPAVYYYEVGPVVKAVFPTEIEALRFINQTRCGDIVQKVGAGDLTGVLQ